ncbi:MAG: tetratricopeptide repeat protein [Verrucomicrobiales bacterium]
MKSMPLKISLILFVVFAGLLFLRGPNENTAGKEVLPEGGSRISAKSKINKVDFVAAPNDAAAKNEGNVFDPAIEAAIESKYEEFMRNWIKKSSWTPEELIKIQKEQRRRARLFVLDKAGYHEEDKQRLALILAKKPPKVWMPAAQVQKYLAAATELSAQDYALAALVAADPTLFNEALSKFPDNPDLLFASLLYAEKFLKDPEGIKKLASLQPDSPWPAILGAVAEMKSGDAASALSYLQRALAAEITPYENNYADAWQKLGISLKAGLQGDQVAWPSDVAQLLTKDSNALLNDIIYSAPEFYKQHQDDPNAAAFAGAALALSERVSETNSLVGERVALMNQLDILTAMGPQAAQPYINLPYQEYVDSLHDRRETLQKQIDTIKSFAKGLPPADKAEFESLKAANGDLAAYEAMRPK